MICELEFWNLKYTIHDLTLNGVVSSRVGGARGGSSGTPSSLLTGLSGGVY